ncbi:hypothetical protein PRVXT_002666 [Proteinivorax tanatarense]|uniref:Transporter n=1 Tax=Proteinivorax tanatarense TaxID=1260629 RepID=A0AAU7VKP8_9FIRM
MERIKKGLLRYATGIEVVLALLILLGVTIALTSVVRYLTIIPQSDTTNIYEVLQNFLSIALLLVIGIELVLMLLTHSPTSVLELVLFAIARKMLVYSETMLELLIATAAIAIVFAIKKYLLDEKQLTFIKKTQNKQRTKLEQPQNIEDLVHYLEDEKYDNQIKEGKEFTVGNLKLKVDSVVDGVVKDMKIERIDDKGM